MSNDEPPIDSTYYSDPRAKFTVYSHSAKDGTGIVGYYRNVFAADLVASWCKSRGHSHVSIEDYNPKEKFKYGMHPLIEAKMNWYLS